MDSSIVRRLERTEEDLLDAIISNEAALEEFSRDWLQLSIDIESARASHQLQDVTVELARTVASRVHLLSSSILSFTEETDFVTTRLEKELNEMFAAMSFGEQFTDSSCTSMPRSTSSLPLYVKPAYTWLMGNLHNPYPPKHIKATISRESGCNVKDIDNWFINVRRRIGWNRLRRVHFANKRQEILSAAACFFGKAGGFQTLDSHLEMEFASIQNNAVNLYSDKFTGGHYSSRPESPNDGGDSDADGSTSAQPAKGDAKDVGREFPTNAVKRSSPSFAGDPQIARKTKRHREDLEAHSCKASKKRRFVYLRLKSISVLTYTTGSTPRKAYLIHRPSQPKHSLPPKEDVYPSVELKTALSLGGWRRLPVTKLSPILYMSSRCQVTFGFSIMRHFVLLLMPSKYHKIFQHHLKSSFSILLDSLQTLTLW